MAEVLITLGIIGVVAAITLPALITNIQDRIKEKRVQNIQQKFSKATDKMLSISGLNGYDSTLDFVNELKNHLSIAKICENDELRNCWPTEKVTLSDGTEWEIAKTTKAKHLKMTSDDFNEWDDTVGIITGDGTSMILSYNKKCDIDPVATPSWDVNRSNSTGCIAAVYDWNGSNKPNKLSNTGDKRADVMLLNAGGLGSSCAIEVNGLCLSSPVKVDAALYTSLNEPKCQDLKDAGYGISYCYYVANDILYKRDYWAVAVAYCGHKDKVATVDDLAKLSDYLYDVTGSSADHDVHSPTSKLPDSELQARRTQLGFPATNSFWIWSSSENGNYSAYDRQFYSSYSFRYVHDRDNSYGYVLCKL